MGRPRRIQEVIEKILRHLKLWPERAEPAFLSRAPASIPPPDCERIIEPFFDDPFLACHGVAKRSRDYDTDPVMAYANDPACHGVA